MTERFEIMIRVEQQIFFRKSIFKDFHWALFMVMIPYSLLEKAFVLSSRANHSIPSLL